MNGQRLVFFRGSFLSNFHPAKFKDKSEKMDFKSSEQAFQAIKALFIARCGETDEVRESARTVYNDIMDATDPMHCKEVISRKQLPMSKALVDGWNKVSAEVMLQSVRLKFWQNLHLRTRLSWFRDVDHFHEALPEDNIWGIGMDAKDALLAAAAGEPFKGESRLGRILRQVLDELTESDNERWPERYWPSSDDAARVLVAQLWRDGAAAEERAVRRPWQPVSAATDAAAAQAADGDGSGGAHGRTDEWGERESELQEDDKCCICLESLPRTVLLCGVCHKAMNETCRRRLEARAAPERPCCPVCKHFPFDFIGLPGLARRALEGQVTDELDGELERILETSVDVADAAFVNVVGGGAAVLELFQGLDDAASEPLYGGGGGGSDDGGGDSGGEAAVWAWFDDAAQEPT